RRIGGRIAQVNSASEVVLDKFVEVRNGDRLLLNLPSGVSESRVVSDSTSVWISVDSTDISVDSDEITADATSDATEVISITVSEPYSETPTPESVWTIESDELTN